MKSFALFLVIFLLGVCGYLALQGRLPSQANPSTPIHLISPESCLLNKGICTAGKTPFQLSLELTPQPVPLMKPVQVKMQLQGLNNLASANLKIEGENMYMGFQTVQLAKLNESDWQGSFSLPICSESEMHWRVTVSLNTPEQAYQASFKLVTQR